MAVKTSNQDLSPAFIETVNEITSLYKSLPPRPSIEDVQAAVAVINTANDEQQSKLDEISKQVIPQDVPDELFSLLTEMRRSVVMFQCHEQRKEALHMVEVDRMFEAFDGLIQRASLLVSGGAQMGTEVVFADPFKVGRERLVRDENESFVKVKEDGESEEGKLEGLIKSSSSKVALFSGEDNTEKLSLMKVAAVIESSVKTRSLVLDLKGKLMDQIEWLPVSIGKLSAVTEMDLSENRIMALPSTVGSLKALTKFDIHSNQLINLPDSFGELINLIKLDLHANRLKSLPVSFRNLTNLRDLDLSSNHFTHLPEIIGDLASLKILNVETNELEELPYTIGNCSSLVELRLDFNQLKALPEAIGKLEWLEILTLHYNRVKGLPTTMGNLSNLRELDVSFNEIESIPENLCFATSLRKLNVGKNFADLRALPRSIGNLEMLEELDISDNQIRVLPESFRLLSKLRVFHADETPLEVPPKEVAILGAQAVVQFMADSVVKTNVQSQPSKKKKRKGFWFRVCSICWPFRSNSQ